VLGGRVGRGRGATEMARALSVAGCDLTILSYCCIVNIVMNCRVHRGDFGTGLRLNRPLGDQGHAGARSSGRTDVQQRLQRCKKKQGMK